MANLENNAREFIRALAGLSAENLRCLARVLGARHQPADELAWWQATMALERALRQYGRGRLAATAAGAASEAVISAAARHGMSADEVRAVALGAAEAARVLVVGRAKLPEAEFLLLGWEDFLPCHTPPPEHYPRVA